MSLIVLSEISLSKTHHAIDHPSSLSLELGIVPVLSIAGWKTALIVITI